MLISVEQQSACERFVTFTGFWAVLGGILFGDKNLLYV